MKNLHILMTIVGACVCICPASTAAPTDPGSSPQAFPDTDTVPAIMLMSASGEDPESLLERIIPCTPQAASLARYAEYPVSLTTGIPDITIPLYEIKMGDFSLPISISYHASGARPDEVPSCVGLGWTLNAGGAVTRTILGGPDLEVNDVSSGDYSYYSMSSVESLIEKVKKGGGAGHLRELISTRHYRDSESDRYCFNAGGHVGVFRYSFKDKKYICLDKSSCRIESAGSGEDSSFKMYCPDNTIYRFTVHEKTGTDSEEEGPPFTTAWYVSQINTPYGDINFNYTDDVKFYIPQTSTYYRSGYYPVDLDYEFAIKSHTTTTNMYYWQKLVSSIEWNGNTVEFEYAQGNPGDLNMRIAKMTVKSSNRSTVKTVSFGNDVPWRSGTEKGRRFLTSLEDSSEGTYEFSYNKGLTFPNVIGNGTPSKYTDSWGYYNGGDGAVLSKDVADWLRFSSDGKFQSVHTNSRDRSPKLAYTILGVLKQITFPTGGTLSYTYELNDLYGEKLGGLRVASSSLWETGNVCTKKYTYYDGVQPQMHPDSLSMHESYLLVVNTYTRGDVKLQVYRTAYSSPLYSPFSKSSPALYTKVREELPDGRYTMYEYEALERDIDPFRQDWHHPSSFPEAVTDRGNNTPVLRVKSRYSTSGILLHRETNTYLHEETELIETGVRLISVVGHYYYDGGSTGYEDNEVEFPEGVGAEQLLRRQTKAIQTATVLKSTVTEDLETGFCTTVSYTHDPDFRTLRPLTEKVTNSDGIELVTRYEYPFHRTGSYFRSMEERGCVDWVLSTSIYSGDKLISKKETEYEDEEDPDFCWALPLAWRSWSAPTASSIQSPPAVLPERGSVGSYTLLGRPESILVNGTDLTKLTWSGHMLVSMAAPGGLETKYTHKPLIGMTSMTVPNGYKTTYSYNDAGMLASVADADGAIESYSYSIENHPVASMTGDGNSITSTRFLNLPGTKTVATRQYLDGFGRPSSVVEGGRNTAGKYLYTAVSYDAPGRQSQTVLPSVGDTDLKSMTFGQVKDLSPSSYGNDQFAWSETTYDGLDRPIKVTTPGNEWHSAGKGKVTEYISNAANSVRIYTAPMTSTSLSTGSYYAAKTLQGVRTVDEDDKEMTVYTDKLGRKVLERRGPESKKGQNDTYFVYNALGQLRFVLSPSYQESANLTEYAYEYRYDQHGNVVYKALPGAGYTEYWYDRSGRLAYMQDANLRAGSLYRFFLYDKAGRQVIQGVCKTCKRDETVNFATYTGGISGFMSTGYTLADASRIQQATLETVAFFDAYTFRSTLDSHLTVNGTASAKGLQTGAVVYASDGSKSVSAIYYDAKGRVTETRELTHFGTKRTTTTSYNYAGQPLKTTLTEGTVSLITENTYDAGSGLLTATDVTVNGTKQCVSKVTYDDLGRIKSVKRGNDTNSGGTVNYTYNIHGQTKSIIGPGFMQNLEYADGTGTKLYNGSVSTMKWKMGTDATMRGYKYSYNDYNWLTAADYGETAALTSNKDRYTEKMTSFTRNGGIKGLQRYGKQASGTYGFVDNLTVSYSGNRISGVSDGAPVVTQNGSMDFPGGSTSSLFSYNAFGALTADPSRGITSITYDNFGNPVQIQFSNGRNITNVYSATGEKLKTSNQVGVLASADAASPFDMEMGLESASSEDALAPQAVVAQSTISYHGPIIYRNSTVDKVLFPGGYATISGTTVTFHYYTQDYLGNNRAVINGSTGATEQTIAYYPFGAVIADLGTPTTGQPYKFGGKELLNTNGLNEYDFGARNYYPAVPGFTKPDQLCEKYYWLSPYIYCSNNPVNYTDPTGMYIVKESQDEWNRNKKDIENRRNSLQNDIDKTKAKGAKKGWSSDKIAQKIGDKQDRVSSLNNTLSSMSTIESSEQGYSLSNVSGSVGEVILKDGNIIDISYISNSMPNFVHEVTHAGQFESGDIAFNETSGKPIFNDIYDEFHAYAAQFAYEPSSLDGINPLKGVNSVNEINLGWLNGIVDSAGVRVYGGSIGITLGRVPVNRHSSIETMLTAYNKNVDIRKFVSTYNCLVFQNLYYKK